MGRLVPVGCLVAAGAAAWLGRWLYSQHGLVPPAHLTGHTLLFQEGLISAAAGDELRDLVRTMGDAGFPTNVQDTSFYTAKRDHIGEAQPIGEDGDCAHPFLVPNPTRDACVIPGRLDIGRHFITTGGINGVRESYETLVARVLSFGAYLFDLSRFSVVERLFSDGKFLSLARKICPGDKQHLDPFQFNFIIQVPGQSVAAHLDGVYFWGASRFNYPQWLLACMQFSNLFSEQFVDQVQVVGYLHEWQPSPHYAGEFVFWDGSSREGVTEMPVPLAGSAVDGTKTVHAANVYMPTVEPPKLDKNKKSLLRFSGHDKWELLSDNEVLQNYTTSDLRISIVYRARCFKDEGEAQRFQDQLQDHENEISLETILATFADDLEAKSIVRSAADFLAMSRLDLALLLMDTYIQYPMPIKPSLMPWNYCAAERLMPWLGPILKPFC
mmetsp:Transcript_22567/g.65622  ORF Transcript_22567/g.65622 Transcript_22567/m.65622 type:complete len:440 (-) Transcript_22567:14-1333(-)